MAEDKTKRLGRWYFGGVAGAMAACCTHPLDLLKVLNTWLTFAKIQNFQVQLQTQQQGKLTIGQLSLKIYKNDGILAFYNGVSASVLRQLTYSTTRFGIYETVKKQLPQGWILCPFNVLITESIFKKKKSFSRSTIALLPKGASRRFCWSMRWNGWNTWRFG